MISSGSNVDKEGSLSSLLSCESRDGESHVTLKIEKSSDSIDELQAELDKLETCGKTDEPEVKPDIDERYTSAQYP